jgi:hypothetical protein
LKRKRIKVAKWGTPKKYKKKTIVWNTVHETSFTLKKEKKKERKKERKKEDI